MNISRGLNLSCVDEKNTLKNIISTRQHLKLKYCFSLGLRGLFLASRLQNASKHLRFFLASFCFSFFRFLFPRWMSTWMGLAIWLCRGTLSGRRILYKFESTSQSIWDIFSFLFTPCCERVIRLSWLQTFALWKTHRLNQLYLDSTKHIENFKSNRKNISMKNDKTKFEFTINKKVANGQFFSQIREKMRRN